MLTFWGAKKSKLCDGISRRNFLRVGALGAGGLTLADLLRLRAQGSVRPETGTKAVIMIFLAGGPSHLDMYDLKPDAPVEYRGDFKPIQTNVPGFDICELMPLQAKIADKMALVRSMRFPELFHGSQGVLTGYSVGDKQFPGDRPAFGSVISRLRSAEKPRALPPYVALDAEVFTSLVGNAHRPFVPFPGRIKFPADAKDLKVPALDPKQEITRERLADRRALLEAFDQLRRDQDTAQQSLATADAFQTQAWDMITAPKVREAFGITREPQAIRDKYGAAGTLLMARRLVEAGVAVVQLSLPDGSSPEIWDLHEKISQRSREVLPMYDRAIHALVTDLHDRGLDKDVAVVVWGEFGRTPKVGGIRAMLGTFPQTTGRDHWPDAGFALMIGGGLQMGQVIGATDPRGARPKGRPYSPQNVHATLYHVLGIDPAATLPDHQGRPIHVLKDPDVIKELI